MDIIGRTKPKGVGKGKSSLKPKLHLSAGCFAPFLLGMKSRLYSDFKIHVSNSIWKWEGENCASESKAEALRKSVILDKRALGHQALYFLIWSCISCHFHVSSPATPGIWLVYLFDKAKGLVFFLFLEEQCQTQRNPGHWLKFLGMPLENKARV